MLRLLMPLQMVISGKVPFAILTGNPSHVNPLPGCLLRVLRLEMSVQVPVALDKLGAEVALGFLVEPALRPPARLVSKRSPGGSETSYFLSQGRVPGFALARRLLWGFFLGEEESWVGVGFGVGPGAGGSSCSCGL